MTNESKNAPDKDEPHAPKGSRISLWEVFAAVVVGCATMGGLFQAVWMCLAGRVEDKRVSLGVATLIGIVTGLAATCAALATSYRDRFVGSEAKPTVSVNSRAAEGLRVYAWTFVLILVFVIFAPLAMAIGVFAFCTFGR